MQRSQPITNREHPLADAPGYRTAFDPFEYYSGMWLVAWLGTIVMGSVLGFFHLPPWGCVVFAPLFAIVAVPIYTTMAIIAWGMSLHRYCRIWIVLAGLLAGATVTLLILEDQTGAADTWFWAGFGGLVVAITSLIGADKFARHHELRRFGPLTDRQYSLGAIFLRTAVLAWLAAMWSQALRMM